MPLRLRINLENLSGFNRCEVRARLSNQELRKRISEIEHVAIEGMELLGEEGKTASEGASEFQLLLTYSTSSRHGR